MYKFRRLLNKTRTLEKTLNNPNQTNQVILEVTLNFASASSSTFGNEYVCGVDSVDSSIKVNDEPQGVGDTVISVI